MKTNSVRRSLLELDGSEEQIQDAIKEALYDAEYGRMVGDSSRSTAKMKEAQCLAAALIRAKRHGTLIGPAAPPAAGSAPGAPDGKKPSGRYSFVILKGRH